MIARIRRALHPRQLYVIAVVAVVEIGLHTFDLPRLTRLLGVRLGVEGDVVPAGKPLPQDIRRQARLMHRALRRWPFGNTCLRRALVLGHLIRRADPVLHIGVRRDENDVILAHAWLQVGGTTLDPTAAEFLTLQQI